MKSWKELREYSRECKDYKNISREEAIDIIESINSYFKRKIDIIESINSYFKRNPFYERFLSDNKDFKEIKKYLLKKFLLIDTYDIDAEEEKINSLII